MGMGLGHTLLADSTGRWHYVWAENDGMVHVSQRQDDGSWSGASPAGSMLLGSQAVFDASDVLHIVGCPTTGVVEVTWSVADGMSIPTTVSNETCAGGFQGATIDAGGRIDAVWNADGVVRFSRRGPGGSWGAPVPLTGVTLAASGARSGPDGRATVAAAKADGSIDLYQASADGAAWEPMSSHLFPLDTVQARAVLAFNWASSSMIVHQTRARLLPTMIYVDEIVFYDVMGRQHTLGASQVVTIPADLNRPMLSTDYRYYDSAGDNVLALGIQGAADGAPTWTVLPSGLGALHGWLDVSAWAGQTVTVSLQLRDGPSANLPVAYFDLVYLASWQTPVVTGLEPAQLASAGGTLTVVGDNFIGTPIVTVAGHPVAVTRIDAQHLTITVPADLPFGRHPLLVTNPAGHATLAATSVRIGSAFLNLPALLRWAPPGSP
jgi:hypothetical protein